MRLTKVQATDYHSIRDSNEFDVGEVTCLVGKNEAGKTALLQAIYRLMPIVKADTGYSVTDDYPRRDVSDYEHEIKHERRNHAVVARLTYELDDDDTAAVVEVFGQDALTSSTLGLSKAYSQHDVTISLGVDEEAALQHVLSPFALTEAVRTKVNACSTADGVKAALEGEEQTEAVKGVTKWVEVLIKAHSITL